MSSKVHTLLLGPVLTGPVPGGEPVSGQVATVVPGGWPQVEEAFLAGHGTLFNTCSFPILGGQPCSGMSGPIGGAPCFRHIWASRVF